MEEHSILWRDLANDGKDLLNVVQTSRGWLLNGTILTTLNRDPCKINYRIECDIAWLTREVAVDIYSPSVSRRVFLTADGERRWHLNGEEMPELFGCTDIDLEFTPASNTLPIRRLNLEVGATARIKAAWLKFPKLAIEAADQEYHRVEERLYKYSSRGGEFETPVEVNDFGLVARYPGQWEIVETA
ncbi:MAG: putative glycolipid-binding domain-containing protein [Gammaproteobacteria bacterium]|nr:putative glycolipid-binding domain-containing protein [Gammaproteobacteria bacterium]